MGSIIVALAAVVIPIVAGFIAKEVLLGQAYINALPGPVPAIVGIVVSYVFSIISQHIGFVLPGSLAGLDQNTIAAALMAVVALLTHTAVQNKVGRASRGLRK